MKTISITLTTAQAASILDGVPSTDVKQILEERLAEPPKTCDSCHGSLRNSLNPFYDAGDAEMDNELWITFRGGFGSFIDTGIERPDIEVIVCHDCAIKMWKEFFPQFLPEHSNIECPCPGQEERTAAFQSAFARQEAAWLTRKAKQKRTKSRPANAQAT